MPWSFWSLTTFGTHSDLLTSSLKLLQLYTVVVVQCGKVTSCWIATLVLLFAGTKLAASSQLGKKTLRCGFKKKISHLELVRLQFQLHGNRESEASVRGRKNLKKSGRDPKGNNPLHCPSCAETLGEQRKEKDGNRRLTTVTDSETPTSCVSLEISCQKALVRNQTETGLGYRRRRKRTRRKEVHVRREPQGQGQGQVGESKN